MKEFTFDKESLSKHARELKYEDRVEPFFKALALPDEITLKFSYNGVTVSEALAMVLETLHGAWCGPCSGLNDFLCFRAASLVDAYELKIYSVVTKDTDDGRKIFSETVQTYNYGAEHNRFVIADGELFSLEGEIEDYFKGLREF